MSGHPDGVTRIGIGIGAALAMIIAGGALAGDGLDCPPNPRPGACYEKVLIQPMYQNGVLIRPGSFDWREIPCATGGGAAWPAPAGYIYASGPADPAADVRVITSPNLVRAVQTALAGKGYYRGPASGFANGETERGLARFQADNRLRPGWTKETLRALGVPYPWGSPD